MDASPLGRPRCLHQPAQAHMQDIFRENRTFVLPSAMTYKAKVFDKPWAQGGVRKCLGTLPMTK